MSSKQAEQKTIEQIVQAVMARVKDVARGGMVAGAIVLTAFQGPMACNEETKAETQIELNIPVPNGNPGKADWAQYEGIRDSSMVTYDNAAWHVYTDCYGRGGCMGVDVFLKLLVRPVAGANLDAKRVGIVFAQADGEPVTATGGFYAMREDGREEWHIKVSRRTYENQYLVFNAWYQDGTGKTYYDDNQGEFHAISYSANYAVVRQEWYNEVVIDPTGVRGTMDIVVADLDYDKEIAILWTTDKWTTVNEFGIGEGVNHWRWKEDVYAGYERWTLDLDIPGELASDAEFEYAIVYRHGVVNNATRYEFWDNNNGYNSHIQQRQPE